jgi:hypothetical protein
MSGKALSIKNDSKINFLAMEITSFTGRGSSTTEKLITTLNEIKQTAGIKSLKDLQQGHIAHIVEELSRKARSGNTSQSNANSYISSINNIVKYIGREDLYVIKASDYGLSRNISEKDGINKENVREAANAYKEWLTKKYLQTNDLRYEALRHAVNIQSVNLRLRESLLIKLRTKDLSGNILKISEKKDGAKNSRAREIKLNPEQKRALIEARDFIKSNKLENLNIGLLKQGRNFANNTLTSFRKETGVYFHYHGERHFTAHEAYKNAWTDKGYSVECRARTGGTKEEWLKNLLNNTGLSKQDFTAIDREIRQGISRDLGHERLEITNRYLG